MRDGSDARGRRVALEERSIKYANLGDNGGRAEDKKDESTESDRDRTLAGAERAKTDRGGMDES